MMLQNQLMHLPHLGKAALEIFSKFCEDGDSETDYSGISKKIGGDAWDYPFDPKGTD